MFKALIAHKATDQSNDPQGLVLVICVGLLCVLLGTGVSAAQVNSNSTADAPEPRASIWTNTAFDLDGGDRSGGLNTTGSNSDGRQEPILVPLPAPLLAAGTGLGLAWILRKRMSRS